MANNLNLGYGRSRYVSTMRSSMDEKSIGSFTDSNQLYNLYLENPAKYDKEMIEIYSQVAPDGRTLNTAFLEMINKATPYYINTASDQFTYKIRKPFENPKIIQNLASGIAKPGLDGQPFSIVLDKNAYQKGHMLSTDYRNQEQVWKVEKVEPYGIGFKYTLTIVSENPGVDFAAQHFLIEGSEVCRTGSVSGEFTRDLPGLGGTAVEIEMIETLGAAYGNEHKITKWADSRVMKQADGKPMDITVITKMSVDKKGNKTYLSPRWQPTIEMLLQRDMLEQKAELLVWGRAGYTKDDSGQNSVYVGRGMWQQMHEGNVVYYNDGEFSIGLLRRVFGDLFYRRTAMGQRNVKIYTNEAGLNLVSDTIATQIPNLFGQATTTINADTFIHGHKSGEPNMNMGMGFGFSYFITSETGKVEFVHLDTLDLPTSRQEFGQNEKSTPIFMVFDMTDMQGMGIPNMRTVRQEGWKNMTWGYVDGRVSHKGIAASQGMQSASTDPWYTMWFEDRCGLFIEDPTRCVIIKQRPIF